MGAQNVAKVFAHWRHLDHRQARGLAYMALIALDAHEPPVYFGGWQAVATAIGKDPEENTETARKAATRVISDLRKAGAVVVSPAVNHSNARYALALDPAQTFEPVGRGRDVRWKSIPRRTLTVPPQRDTHRPTGEQTSGTPTVPLQGDSQCPDGGTPTVPPQGDTGGPRRGTLTVPRRSKEEPLRGTSNEYLDEDAAPLTSGAPAAVDNPATRDRSEASLDDRKNDQLARLAQWEAVQQATDERRQDTTEPGGTIVGEIVDGDGYTTSDAFARFWEAYPGDRKFNRGKCREQFAQAVKAGADPEHIVQGALTYRHEPKRLEDPAFTVAPLRWLEEERWESGPTPAPRTASQKRAFQGLMHKHSISDTPLDTSDPWDNPFEARAQREALEATDDSWPATGTDMPF